VEQKGMAWIADGVQRYPSDKRKKLLRPNEIVDVREGCKMPEFSEKSLVSRAEKHSIIR
jgi:hypothetical protein